MDPCHVSRWIQNGIIQLITLPLACEQWRPNPDLISSRESSLICFRVQTSSMAHANKGLFEPARRPWLTQVVSLSFPETTEEPGLGCFILQKFIFSYLHKHFLVPFDERIPKMPKNLKKVDVLRSHKPSKCLLYGTYYSQVTNSIQNQIFHPRWSRLNF